MAVAGMRRMSFVGLVREKEEILNKLQDFGLVHISSFNELAASEAAARGDDDGADLSDPAPEELMAGNDLYAGISEKRKILKKCIEELAPFDERKKSLFSFLRPVKAGEIEDAYARRESILAEAYSVIKTDEKIKDAEEAQARLESELSSIAPWKAYPYVPSLANTSFTVTEFLSAESQKEADSFSEALTAEIPESGSYMISADKGLYCFAAVCLREDQTKLDRLISSGRITRYDFSNVDSAPAEYAGNIENYLSKLRDSVSAFKSDREEAARHIGDFEMLYDRLGIEASKMVADANFANSSVTFSFEGWVPSKNEKQIRSILEDGHICHVEFRDPRDGELPPTKLENGFLGASIEPVESLYSLLRYGQLDPSAIAAFFYALFFGFMFSDAGYGIMLTVACIIILVRCKLKENMRKYIVLFLVSGISTIFWGVIFGSWFGNLVQTVTRGSFALKPLWFDPQDSANTEHFLAFTLLLGVIHLFTAMAMKAANLIAKGKWLDAIFDVLFWYIFYIGEILFLLPYIPYYGKTAFCERFSPYGIYFLLAGFVLILFTKGRKSKNPFIKLFGGITCLYSLVDMLSDCLSYTRLMAMGLATSVIINVFNSIAASAAGLDTAGITFRFIVFVIIFVAANLFNFAINALGAYVNACRLTYIEFFGKCYEGDGREDSPLRFDTEYVYIEKDDKANVRR